MKKIKKLISALLVVAILSATLTPVAAAKTTGSYVRVSIPATKFTSDYTAYDSESEAKQHTLTLTIEANQFPVKATIVGKNNSKKDYTFDGYGTKRLQVNDVNMAVNGGAWFLTLLTFGLTAPLAFATEEEYRYAYIEIKAPAAETAPTNKSPVTNQSATTTTPAGTPSAQTFDERYQRLLKEVGFPFTYTEYSTYAKELKAFMTGEWNGKWRTGDDWGSYVASRQVVNRTYTWTASNLHTGQSYQLQTNVDYIGYNEVIHGVTSSQDYSLAVDRVNNVIEQWSLLERRDRWELQLSGETITSIFPLGSKGDTKDDCQVLVMTEDADGVQHMYSLLPGEKVEKTI